MPASTLDPVNAALRTALSKSASTNNLDAQLAGSSKKALLSDIQFEPAGSYHSSVLDKLKSKYIVLKSTETPEISKQNKNNIKQENMGADEGLVLSKYELFPLKNVQLGWNNSDWSVGAGMVNMGNTCYLNSTLQALFHVPALVNWLISDRQHMNECEDSGGGMCIICAMRKTLQDSQQRNINTIRPFLIYNKLRVVCRNLIPGRQEDAHEFLRYLVEAMEKAYLSRFKNHSEFDSRTKETTPLNQILGGYLRSTVRCLECGHVSTTFQHFQDLLLDIRKAQTLEEALEGYFSKEKLDDDSYHCEACQKKVPATKQFSVERAPMVLCIQLKRFSVSNNKIAKHIQFKQRLELTKYMRRKPPNPLLYRLVAMVTHMGPTVGCGHYTAVAQAPSGNFYQFDDSMVRPISHQAVFSTNAYIMLYELEPQSNNNVKKQISATSSATYVETEPCKSIHLNGNNNKVYGPELPPKINAVAEENGKVVFSLNGSGKANEVTSYSSTTSSSSESETEQTDTQKENKSSISNSISDVISSSTNTKMKCSDISPNTPFQNNFSPNNEKSVIPLKGPPETNSLSKTSQETVVASQKDSSTSLIKTSQESTVSSTQNTTKLVPYDMDDSSSCSEENNLPNLEPSLRVVTKATSGEWKVSSSTKDDSGPSSEGKSWDKKKNNVVSDLLRMSHSGYSAPVLSWNGTRSLLDKEINIEKREERKRSLVDDSDQGRVKTVKLNNQSNGTHKPSIGYNPIQVYHNMKNWGANNGSAHHYRPFYNAGNRHRNANNHRNFHRNKNFHKNYRYRQ